MRVQNRNGDFIQPRGDAEIRVVEEDHLAPSLHDLSHQRDAPGQWLWLGDNQAQQGHPQVVLRQDTQGLRHCRH